MSPCRVTRHCSREHGSSEHQRRKQTHADGARKPGSDMEKTDFLSLGRTSPESSGSGSPIKAIRISRDEVKEGGGELLAPLADSVGWSSAWNENDFDKVRNACQRRKVGVLLTENRKLTKDRKAAIRTLHLTEEKLSSKTAEALRLREVNALVLERLRQSGGSRQAELRVQENRLRVEFDEAMQRVRAELGRKHDQERQAAVEEERCAAERRCASRIDAVEGLLRDREAEVEETKKELAKVKGSLEEQMCKHRDEIEKLEVERLIMKEELEKCKNDMEANGKCEAVRGATNTHVMLILLKTEDPNKKASFQNKGDLEFNSQKSPFSLDSIQQCPFGVEENAFSKITEFIDKEEEEEEEECMGVRRGDLNCGTTLGLSRGVKAAATGGEESVETEAEFTRPIPSGIMWADLQDPADARWYAESTVDGDAGEDDFGDSETITFMEGGDEEHSDAPGAELYGRIDLEEEEDKEKEEEDKEIEERDGSAGEVDGYDEEEPNWWCKNERGNFRSFSHFLDAPHDSGRSRQSSIRTGRRSYDSPTQSPRFPSSKASTPTTDSCQEWSCNSPEKDPSSPEWSNRMEGCGEFGSIQKVSPGVLVVERLPNFGNTPMMPPKRSQSDVPQCRRWLAGYCRFHDRCWFRHE